MSDRIYFHERRKQWVGTVELPRGADGKRRRKFFYNVIKAEVEAQVTRALNEKLEGTACAPSEMTVATLLDAWLAQKKYEEEPIRKSTQETYAFWIPYINKSIGGVRVQKLSIENVEFLLKELREAGLSNQTRRTCFGILRRALKFAVARHKVNRNVTDHVKAPPKSKHAMAFLTSQEITRLLSAAKGSWFAPVIKMAVYSGMRMGEVLGLQWSDVQGDEIRVFHQLRDRNGTIDYSPCPCCGVTDGRGEIKTESGRRTLDMTPDIRSMLNRQKERLLKAGLAASPWVFPSQEGTPINQNNLRRAFKVALKKAGLKSIRFHDLRHSCASILHNEYGWPDFRIQKWLGHSDAAMLQVYLHVWGERRKRDAEQLQTLPYSQVTV